MKIIEESYWDNPFIEELLEAHPAKFGFIMESAEKFRLQVLVSEVTHDQNPRFVRYGYRLDNEYFYPARCYTYAFFVFVLCKISSSSS
jgi:hypothetical protein